MLMDCFRTSLNDNVYKAATSHPPLAFDVPGEGMGSLKYRGVR